MNLPTPLLPPHWTPCSGRSARRWCRCRWLPAGTGIPIRSVALLDADDLAAAEPGARVADLCVLAGVSADAAIDWLARSQSAQHQSAQTIGQHQSVQHQSTQHQSALPVALVTKDASADLCRSAEAAGVAVGTLHAQAGPSWCCRRCAACWTVPRRGNRPTRRQVSAFAEESDLYGLAQRVAALTGGLVSIEDDQSRLLAYSATDGAADELRMLSILGREGPADTCDGCASSGCSTGCGRARAWWRCRPMRTSAGIVGWW